MTLSLKESRAVRELAEALYDFLPGSKLIDLAVRGESFVIAKSGRPLVKVTALEAPSEPRRLGFLAGEIAVPDDFDRMGQKEIEALFGLGA